MRTDAGEQGLIYRILDSQGGMIGRVRVPQGQPSLGRGAGTVLLLRDRNPAPATLAGRRSGGMPAVYPG
jgi:hypothetical protein